MVCRIALLPIVESSYCHPLDPGQHYLRQALNAGYCAESEAMLEDEWRQNVSIASDQPKDYDVFPVWVFYQYKRETVLGLTPNQSGIFVSVVPL